MPEENEIEHNLRRFPMRTRSEKKHNKLIEQIKEIMHPDLRRYLTVFRINSELNMKQTIFHAIFKGREYFWHLFNYIFLLFISLFCPDRFIQKQ